MDINISRLWRDLHLILHNLSTDGTEIYKKMNLNRERIWVGGRRDFTQFYQNIRRCCAAVYKKQVFILSAAFIFGFVSYTSAQKRPMPPEEQAPAPVEGYQENALRRFEIITLSALPFTSIHSYVAVRGIKMYSEKQFAPELTPQDYRIIGIGAVSLSIFIGVWDWWRTRSVDTATPRIQKPEPPPPIEDEEPTEGVVARLLDGHSPYPRATSINTGFYPALQNRLRHTVNTSRSEPLGGLTLQLIQIRF